MSSNTIYITLAAFSVYLLFGAGIILVKNVLKNEKKIPNLLLTILLTSFIGGIVLLSISLIQMK